MLMGLDEAIKQAKSRIDIYRDALPAAPKTLGQTAMAAFIAEQEVLLAELTRLRRVEREQRALMDLFDRRLIYFGGEFWYGRRSVSDEFMTGGSLPEAVRFASSGFEVDDASARWLHRFQDVRLRDLAMLSDEAIVQMLRPYFEEAQDDE